MGTRGQWAHDLAVYMGNPNPSPQIVNLLSCWSRAEFAGNVQKAAKYNPLATTLKYGTDWSDYNSVGVKNYRDRQTGIEATSISLSGNYVGYEEIRNGIKNNDPEFAIKGMLNPSVKGTEKTGTWGTNFQTVQGCYRTSNAAADELPAEDSKRWDNASPPSSFPDQDSPGGDNSGSAPSVSFPSQDDWKSAGKAMLGTAIAITGGLLMLAAIWKGMGAQGLIKYKIINPKNKGSLNV